MQRRFTPVMILSAVTLAIAGQLAPHNTRATLAAQTAPSVRISAQVAAQVAAQANAIPVLIALQPASPIQSEDDELMKVSVEESVRPLAQEAKDLMVAQRNGRQIDERRLAALQAQIKTFADEAKTRAKDVLTRVAAHNTEQFRLTTDRFKGDMENISCVTVDQILENGAIAATVRHDAVDRLARLPYVSAIISNTAQDTHPTLASAVPNAGAPRFWNLGVTGTGIAIGVMGEGVKVHPNLNVTSRTNCTTETTIYIDHETRVAGSVGSTGAVDKGPLYTGKMYDAKQTKVKDTSNPDLPTQALTNDTLCALNWLVAKPSADVVVYSYSHGPGTGNSEIENIIDYYADNFTTLQVGANGNTPKDTKPAAPASARNSLSVTGYDDGNRIPANRTLDTPAYYHVDGPTNDGRKKPELAAPGVSITTTSGTNSWAEDNGSSFAAPITAGIAGLLIQNMQNIGITDNLQTRARAILINSAEGVTKTSTGTNGWWDPVMGWGKLDGNQAWLDDNKTVIGTLAPGASADYYFSATNGDWLKFTMVWKRHMSDWATESSLQDLDLELFNMAGVRLDLSTSGQNTVEQVKFQAKATDTYRLHVSGWNQSKTETFVLAGRVPLRTTP